MTGKTIVYLPNWLGDLVMATPFLLSLRESLEGELWAIGKSRAMHLYHGLNLFDRFIPNDDKNVVTFLDTVSRLRSLQFERGVILPHSFRSGLLFYLSSVKGRIGYARNRRGFMLTQDVAEQVRPEPTVEHYLRIIDTLGAERTHVSPTLCVTQDEEQKFDEKYTDIGSGHVALIIGAQYGPSKRWPDAYFSELADMLVNECSKPVYILPSPDEEEIARKVHDRVNNKEQVKVRTMDIRELKVCLSRASLVVSNDTGPRHISVALSVPTIIVLGPMDERYTTYPTQAAHVLWKDVSCRPCNRKTCDRGHECMKGITSADVLMKAKEIFSHGATEARAD